MIAYGLRRYAERGCCPGHGDFPREVYKNRRSVRAHRRDTKRARRRARRTFRSDAWRNR
jgi:hypothetical protein